MGWASRVVSSDDDTTSDLTVHLEYDKSGPVTKGGVLPSLVALTGHDAGRIYVLDSYETLLGRADECDIQVLEATVSRRHARLISTADGVEAFDLRSSNGLTVNGDRVDRRVLHDQDVIGLGGSVSFKFAYVTESEQHYQNRLFDNAAHDPLTRLYNKRYFLGVLEQRLAAARKRLDRLALLMVDLDHFKVINDTHGHPFGDEALCHVSTLLRHEIRDKDIAGRYGGEEFVMVVTDVDAEGAVRIAERVRQAIESNPLTSKGEPVPLTVSIGLALASEVNGVAERFIALADERLYTAKRNGRNQVCSGADTDPRLTMQS
ncbi:GGDEF domain-containing protein [Roseospira goensis]|uniref:diguanylate cyclase n=1 Tax=Roseospira goensis TaxID=391922 RepID=A0A7W6WKN3_9PROT|nr:GGDEF domain-containing protein [Roseospira goensis]MBB4286275.1 diguanylate cyclase (GGDEF)-like protein [Roseospira goensis]